MSRDRCPYPGCHDCFGYQGDYDNLTCLCPCHDERTEEADGRQVCQAHDKRWAEPGRTACALHRKYGKAMPA